MKILFSPSHYIHDPRLGSEASWAYNITTKISSMFPNSLIITGKNRSKNNNRRIIEVDKKNDSFNLSYSNAIRFSLLIYTTTIKICKNERFDIIHHVLPFRLHHTVNLYFLLSHNKIPKVVGPIQKPLDKFDKDASDLKIVKDSLFENVIRWLVKFNKSFVHYLSMKTLLKANKVIVISNYEKEYLVRYGINSEKIHVIPPGIEVANYNVKTSINYHKPLRLITVGYLIKRKSIDQIIKSIALLDFDLTLTIIGGGPEFNNLREISNDLGISNKINFIGQIDHELLPKYYQNSDVYISMSTDESWGQVYLEAFASGLPVISTRNHGADIIIKENETGYKVPLGDINSLASKIQELHIDRKKLELMSKAARHEAETKYDWDKFIIPQYNKLYFSLI